jgi:serine/threonine-protein phosphatase with EF-hand domain
VAGTEQYYIILFKDCLQLQFPLSLNLLFIYIFIYINLQLFSELDKLDEAETLLLATFTHTLLEHEFDEFVLAGKEECEIPIYQYEKMLSVDGITVMVDDAVKINDIDITDYTLPNGVLKEESAAQVENVYVQGGKLSRKSLHGILKAMYKTVVHLPNTWDMRFGRDEKLTVVGDIHGQVEDLLYILNDSGYPGPNHKYIFNGDFVDRGRSGVECVTLLFSLYLSYPGCVFINRGNHEDKDICKVYGFKTECVDKYDTLTYTMFCEIFNNLPLCAVVNNALFVIHGGLFHETPTLADINRIMRTDYKAETPNPNDPRNVSDPDGFYLRQLQICALWSDPHPFDTILPNTQRGAGVLFGPDMTMAFLQKNALKLVVRSHECVEEGISWPFKGTPAANKLVTVFSVSDYMGSGNKAAYMVFYNHNVFGSSKVEDCDIYHTTHMFSTSSNHSCSNMAQQESVHLLHELIMKKRNVLQSTFAAADVDGSGFVPKGKWAEVMRRTTKVSILWIPMVPIIVPSGAINEEGDIDYNKFLMKYQAGANMAAESEANMEQLYKEKKKLETIFNFFDSDRSGAISREEFRIGCEAVNKSLPPDKQLGNADAILDLMDFDGDDEINMNEFFEVFSPCTKILNLVILACSGGELFLFLFVLVFYL